MKQHQASLFCRWFEFTLQQGLERSNYFLPVSEPLLLESITKLAFPSGALLTGLTQWRQGSESKQVFDYPIVYNLSNLNYTCGSCLLKKMLKKMSAASPGQRAIYDWAWSGNSQASINPHKASIGWANHYVYRKQFNLLFLPKRNNKITSIFSHHVNFFHQNTELYQ